MNTISETTLRQMIRQELIRINEKRKRAKRKKLKTWDIGGPASSYLAAVEGSEGGVGVAGMRGSF